MASKVDSLVRNFLRTDADSLCLVVGETLYVERGETRSTVGREALSESSFRAIADELSPGDLMESLVDTAFSSEYRSDEESEPVTIQFCMKDGRHAMTVVRVNPLPARPAASNAPAASADPGLGRSSFGSGAEAPNAPAAAPGGARTIPLSPDPGEHSGAGGATAGSAFQGAAKSEEGRSGGGRARSSERPLDRILIRMLAAGASDVHLSSASHPIFRVHGEITPQTDMAPLTSDEIEQLLDPILPDKVRKEFAERNDADFAYEIEGVSRFRVNVFRDRRGVGTVMRSIPVELLSAEQLNLPPAVRQLAD